MTQEIEAIHKKAGHRQLDCNATMQVIVQKKKKNASYRPKKFKSSIQEIKAIHKKAGHRQRDYNATILMRAKINSNLKIQDIIHKF